MVRLRSTPLVVTLSSTYSELSLQFSSGLQSRLMGSQPGAPGMGPYGPSIHCSCIRTRKSQAFFGEQLAAATVAAAAASCSRSMRQGWQWQSAGGVRGAAVGQAAPPQCAWL